MGVLKIEANCSRATSANAPNLSRNGKRNVHWRNRRNGHLPNQNDDDSLLNKKRDVFEPRG